MLFKKKKERVQTQLLDELLKAQSALNDAYSDFEIAMDEDMIDSSIYEMNSIIKKYNYILKSMHKD